MFTRRGLFFLLAAVMICSLAACVSSPSQNTEKEERLQALTDSTIEEFINFIKVPHPSFHTEKALEYLISFAEANNLEYSGDDYGNFWMDIPATAGYESYPKVILQGHMDMVCVSDFGKKVDFKNVGITAIVDGSIIRADGTSLGADNGIAVGMILALAKSDVAHGPVRCLITTDEEVGLLGAARLPAEVLDADYLINIDSEKIGEIIYSNAGDERANISNQCLTTPTGDNQAIFSLSVSGLRGGHSGVDISKNRLSANVVIADALNGLILEGIGIQLISADCGTAANSISPHGTVTFAVPEEKAASVAPVLEDIMDNFADENPDETIKSELERLNETGLDAISSEESAAIIKLAASFPQGVIAMSEKTEGLVATSFNFGLFNIEKGMTEIVISFRSCITDDIERLEEKFREKTAEMGFDYKILAKYPGYDGDPKAPLLGLAKKAYKSAGIKAVPIAIHAGLECSWFASLREGIQMVCIGPTIENAHSVKEILHIDTVRPVIETVLYCLEKINTLK